MGLKLTSRETAVFAPRQLLAGKTRFSSRLDDSVLSFPRFFDRWNCLPAQHSLSGDGSFSETDTDQIVTCVPIKHHEKTHEAIHRSQETSQCLPSAAHPPTEGDLVNPWFEGNKAFNPDNEASIYASLWNSPIDTVFPCPHWEEPYEDEESKNKIAIARTLPGEPSDLYLPDYSVVQISNNLLSEAGRLWGEKDCMKHLKPPFFSACTSAPTSNKRVSNPTFEQALISTTPTLVWFSVGCAH